MKKHRAFISLILLIFPVFVLAQDDLSKHRLSVDFGSFRNRYLYPVTEVKYDTPVWTKLHSAFSVRLRSYGTLFFFSNSAYDITPLASYYFGQTDKPVFLSAGVGMDARIRVLHDERSEAKSSVEPLISLAFHARYKKIALDVPLWTRFYNNGISFALLPEASCKLGKKFSLFVRYELSLLSVYKASTHEWRQDSFLGATYVFTH